MTTTELAIPKGFVFDTSTPAKKAFAEVLLTFPVLDPDDIEDRSLLTELSVNNAESLFSSPDTQPLDEMIGEPFWLLEVVGILASSVKGHEGEPYMLMTARTDDGRRFTVSTGSHYSMRRAAIAHAKGLLPRRVCSVSLVSKGDPSRSSLWLVDRPLRSGPVIDATSKATDDEEPF